MPRAGTTCAASLLLLGIVAQGAQRNTQTGLLRIGDIGGAISLVYEADSAASEDAGGGGKTSSDTQDLREMLEVGFAGSIYHPRLLRFAANVGMELEQGVARIDSPGSRSSDSLRGQRPVYNVHGTLLAEHPVSLDFGFARRTATVLAPYAVPLTVDGQTERLALRLHRGPLPATLYYNHSTTRQDQRSLGEDRSEEDTVWGFTTQHHAGPSTSDFRFESRDSTDDVTNVGAVTTAYVVERHVRDTTFTNRLDLGGSGASNLFSRIWYNNETGTYSSSRFAVDEVLHLQHTRRFSTYYGVSYSREQTRGATTETTTEHFGASHQLYESLFTTFELRGSQQRFDGSSRDETGAFLSANYRKHIPYGMLLVDMGAGYEVTDEKGGTGLRPVLEERQVLDDSEIVFLDNVDIVESTIVVTTADASRRLLALDVDYRIIPQGNRIEIRRVVSSIWVDDGDPVLVSYSYVMPAPISYATRTTRAGVRVDLFDSLSLYARRSDITQELRSGVDLTGRLGDTTDTLYGLEWRYGIATLTLERQDHDDFRTPYTSDRVTLDLRKPLGRHSRLGARAASRHVTYPGAGDATFQSLSATYDLTRPFWPTVAAEVGTEWEDDRGFERQYAYGRVEVTHRIRSVEIKGSWQLNMRDDEGSRRETSQLFLSVRREF